MRERKPYRSDDFDLHEFVLIRLGEKFDAEGRTGVLAGIAFAARHWWFGSIDGQPSKRERRWAAEHYADHPDYREEWLP